MCSISLSSTLFHICSGSLLYTCITAKFWQFKYKQCVSYLRVHMCTIDMKQQQQSVSEFVRNRVNVCVRVNTHDLVIVRPIRHFKFNLNRPYWRTLETYDQIQSHIHTHTHTPTHTYTVCLSKYSCFDCSVRHGVYLSVCECGYFNFDDDS